MKQKELPIIQKTYDVIKWFIPKIEKFPRTQKFVLGDRIEMAFLDFLKAIAIASKRRKKQEILEMADAKLFEIRYLIRLIVECSLKRIAPTNFTNYHELILLKLMGLKFVRFV